MGMLTPIIAKLEQGLCNGLDFGWAGGALQSERNCEAIWWVARMREISHAFSATLNSAKCQFT